MDSAVKELTKSSLAVVILVGALMFLISAAGGVTIPGGLSIQIASDAWRIAIALVGVAIIAVALWRFSREPSYAQTGTTGSLVEEYIKNEMSEGARRAASGNKEIHMLVVNRLNRPLQGVWIRDGQEHPDKAARIAPGGRMSMITYATDQWLVRDPSTKEDLLIWNLANGKYAYEITVKDV